MKVLVTGYTGQLGFDVVRELKARNIECIGTTRNEFSLTDTEKMQDFVKAYIDMIRTQLANASITNVSSYNNVITPISSVGIV